MRATRLLLVSAVSALALAPLMAQGAKAPMRVSVTVVRSCTISAERAVVGVDCGRQQPPMRVASASAPGATSTRPGAPPRVVTIDF